MTVLRQLKIKHAVCHVVKYLSIIIIVKLSNIQRYCLDIKIVYKFYENAKM